jgi:hypothetical protein
MKETHYLKDARPALRCQTPRFRLIAEGRIIWRTRGAVLLKRRLYPGVGWKQTRSASIGGCVPPQLFSNKPLIIGNLRHVYTARAI